MKVLYCFFLVLIAVDLVMGNEEYEEEYEDEDEMELGNVSENSTLIFTKHLENMTVDSGTKMVKLICEVQNLDVNNTDAKITITWKKNYAPIEKTKKRINIKMVKDLSQLKYRSTLRINNLELFDRGFYSCLASNGFKKIRSEALLELLTDSGRTLSTINSLKFDSEITTIAANPPPSSRIFTISHNNQNKKSFKSVKNVNSNGLISSSKLISNFSGSVCQVYKGEVCKSILGEKLVFIQPPNLQEDIEQKLADAVLQFDPQSPCVNYLKSFYCFSAFPVCRDLQQVNIKTDKFFSDHSDFKQLRNELGDSLERICKEDCLLLENDICTAEYKNARQTVGLGLAQLEDCRLLRDRFKNCLALGIKRENVNPADTCYWEDGRAYRGDESITKYGKKCLRWGQQSMIKSLDYPELIGHNHCRNPGGSESQPFCFIGDPPRKEFCNVTKCSTFDFETKPMNFSEPLCQAYRGLACKEVLRDQYVFVQPNFSQADIEKKLRDAFLVISQSNDISSSCNKFAMPSLCYSAFPLCENPQDVNMRQASKLKAYPGSLDMKSVRNQLGSSLRRICKEDCLLLETELCSQEYAIAKRHEIIKQPLDLEDCQFLPNETEVNAKHCLVLGVDHQSVNKEDTCYWDNGQLYRGIENTTVFGNKCLRWSNVLNIRLAEHPELTGNNYCRNPGGIKAQPFCYVDGNPKRIEFCNITKCNNIVWLYIIGCFVTCSIILALIIGIICCRKKNKAGRNLQNINVPIADKNIYGNTGSNPPMELNNLLPSNIPPQRNHTYKNGYQNVHQYSYKEVAFAEELGEGAFGKVYKGELKTKTGKIFVAVKSLKENASAKTQADFQREIELISELKHPNVIGLLGVVVKQQPMCMLFEFMSEGDLHEFLIGNSPSEGNSLTQNQFLHIAIQIAQGMEYLSDNHYVHRDLAARNCLVSKDLVVKISDFGLSRDMYSCDYYRVQSKSLLPVRWMPPESILYGKFTTESDVWSYGVVLWEIYSYGLQPYYGYNNQEVINMIRSRKLLPCPDACPSYCYALMVECWAELSIRRPTFGEISHRLRVWKQNGTSNGAFFKTSDYSQNSQLKLPHSSKSSRKSSDSPTVCSAVPSYETATWERKRLTESQSSLTSRTSSLGNKTQSTSLSNEHSKKRNHKRNEDSLDRVNPKNTIVSSNGDNFEIKLSL